MNEADTCRKQVVRLPQNLQYVQQFYVAFSPDKFRQTASGTSALNIHSTLSSKSETASRISTLDAVAAFNTLLAAVLDRAFKGEL